MARVAALASDVVTCTGWPALAAVAAAALAASAEGRAVLDTTVQATVPGRPRPIEPPTCWPTLGRLAASPASRSGTLDKAIRVTGMNSVPSPAAVTIRGPSSPLV